MAHSHITSVGSVGSLGAGWTGSTVMKPFFIYALPLSSPSQKSQFWNGFWYFKAYPRIDQREKRNLEWLPVSDYGNLLKEIEYIER